MGQGCKVLGRKGRLMATSTFEALIKAARQIGMGCATLS
jgi:hypothetical protein